MQRIAVLGIGNILMMDDGVGVEVASKLADLQWPENVKIYDAGTAIMNMLDVFLDNDKLIIVDALTGGYEPGSIYRLTPEQLSEWQTDLLSLHDVQVIDMFKLAALFNRQPEVIIYGIEPYIIDFNLGLSAMMEERLPLLMKHIRQELAALG